MNSKFILIVLCCLLLSCSTNQPIEQNVIVVKVPPIYDEKLSQEENYYRFQHFLFPQLEIPNSIPKGLPNDDSLFSISVEEDGELKLNSYEIGSISETKPLTEQLETFFQERERLGVYETGSWKIVKAVGIQTAPSIKYGDFIKVVEAVKQSGADPIVLLFDDDARPKLIIDNSTIRKTKQ
ncbi:MAG: hypothetical protein LH614_20645 [Pyrinomonadaceae bacterium]|nr:hypothetical protein [Pyrinomonadaceae bacterium]